MHPVKPFLAGLAVGIIVAIGAWNWPRQRFTIVSSWKVPVRIDHQTGESWAIAVGEGGRKYWEPMLVGK
jgi:hypothetical protein